MKRFSPMGLWLVLCLLTNACGGESRADKVEESVSAVTVTDGIGRKISLNSPARRIVSLSPGVTESLFAVGCGDSVILRDTWSNYPSSAMQLPVTDGVQPNPDAIAGFRPDLVVMYFSDDRFVDSFSRVGIDVAVFDPKNYEEVTRHIEVLGVLCGQPSAARKLAREMRRRKKAVQRRSRTLATPSIYVEVDPGDGARPWTAAGGSFVDELVRSVGGRNIFAALDKPYAQVGLEEIIRANPQVLLLAGVVSPGDAIDKLIARPGFARVDGVVNGRILHHIDKDLLTRPGPRLADGLEALFRALHPSAGGAR